METVFKQSLECFNSTDVQILIDTINSKMLIVSWIIFTVALPIICVAMYGLYFLIRTDHVAPVYVINLLVSDVLQICIRPILHMVSPLNAVYAVIVSTYFSCVMVNVCFMVCIAAERYLMVVFPVWYRFHRSFKKSVCVSSIAWLVPIMTRLIALLMFIMGGIHCSQFFIGPVIFYLLPYPLIMFFFVGTWRALSKSTSVSPQEQRWIMGTLALVLCIYTVFFLPYTVSMVISIAFGWKAYMLDLRILCETLLCMNPVLDPLLYVFLRKDAKYILDAFPCCHCERKDQVQPETSSPIATDKGYEETQT